jgi:hypothetical protein
VTQVDPETKRDRPLVISFVLMITLASCGKTPTASSPSAPAGGLPGIQTGPAPWQPEYAHLTQRLQTIGLPSGPSMSELLHHHDLLQVFVNGSPVEVPASIGIDQAAGYLTSLHTHDGTGIIHVESPVERSFDLGEFFDVWGVRLTSTCLGGYCNDGSQALQAFVDGNPFSGDPRTIPLTQHEDIVLAFGTTSELPSPIPSTYSPSISASCAPSC